MQNSVFAQVWLSRIGLGLIFCYCILASIFFSYFAQMNVSLSFLPFPIFVGEILMFVCAALLLGLSKETQLLTQRTVYLLSLYFAWVFIKAVINYYYDGPLAFRNAALFYYPIFAVFAYCFYLKARIPRKVLMILALLAAFILFFKIMIVWYWWLYITFFIMAVFNVKSFKLKWLGWIFLVVILLLGKEYLYKGPRAHFVSVFGAGIFIVLYFGNLLAKHRKYFYLGVLLTSFFLFAFGFFIFADRDAVSSLTSLKGIIKSYQDFDRRYQENLAGFVPQKLSVHLYNPKKYGDVLASPTNSNEPSKRDKSSGSEEWSKSGVIKTIVDCHIRQGRSLDLDETNIVFRLFVWRDMLTELIEKRAWWGFSFGHPQRSKSLEVLNWAKSEWGRDGWITPHNSYFHIIYRSGILGFCFIGILFYMVWKLAKDFLDLNSIEGGLLVGGVVYWLVLSNFFVILEFPYNAIVFWSLLGVSLAYCDDLKIKGIEYETKR